MDADTIAEIGHFDDCPEARSPCCNAPITKKLLHAATAQYQVMCEKCGKDV